MASREKEIKSILTHIGDMCERLGAIPAHVTVYYEDLGDSEIGYCPEPRVDFELVNKLN